MAFAYADKNIVWVLAIGGYKKLKLFFYISLNTAANPPEGRIVISALSALVTDIFTLLYPR